MVDSETADGLTALIEKLSAPVSAPLETARLIVATDWSKAAMPLTALRAFRALVPPSAPLQLVFAVPHEPSEADAACVHVLLDELEGEDQLDGLEVESFDTVLEKAYDAALVPTLDSEADLFQLGGFILRMRDLVRLHESHRAGGRAAGVASNQGSLDALRDRLAVFKE